MEFLYFVNIGVSLIFAVGGIVTKRVTARSKPNLWFGVRNKYTMENKEIWRKSNELAGTLMMILSFIMVLPNFVFYENSFTFYMYYTNLLTIIGLIIISIIVIKYAKSIYQKQ
ncbi:SdpI family protein [Fusibacter bizertensis]|uniref:SdpI family protein n=1 Tax=Fusibacter bizertensis TaxID=1488331 RepID=UPI003CCB1D81